MDDMSRVENEVSEIQNWIKNNFGFFGSFAEKLDALEEKLDRLEKNIITLKEQFEDKNNGSN
jgi:peptidoglycan hydrolase CwlO-like protein